MESYISLALAVVAAIASFATIKVKVASAEAKIKELASNQEEKGNIQSKINKELQAENHTTKEELLREISLSTERSQANTTKIVAEVVKSFLTPLNQIMEYQRETKGDISKLFDKIDNVKADISKSQDKLREDFVSKETCKALMYQQKK